MDFGGSRGLTRKSGVGVRGKGRTGDGKSKCPGLKPFLSEGSFVGLKPPAPSERQRQMRGWGGWFARGAGGGWVGQRPGLRGETWDTIALAPIMGNGVD